MITLSIKYHFLTPKEDDFLPAGEKLGKLFYPMSTGMFSVLQDFVTAQARRCNLGVFSTLVCQFLFSPQHLEEYREERDNSVVRCNESRCDNYHRAHTILVKVR